MKNLLFTPERASTFAASVDSLYFYLVAITLFFSVLIAGLILFFTFKYRRKSDSERPKPIHGNIPLELMWTIIPFLITMTIFLWGVIIYVKYFEIPKNAMEIFVVGKQWMWKIQHPEGPREINELHVPINQPVKLLMTSEDVIHDFYVPAFRMKMDVLPGTYTEAWFEATKPGTYHLFCAEYCGTKHSEMIGKVIAMEPEAYEAWLSERINPTATTGSSSKKQGSVVEIGAELFKTSRCDTCHNTTSAALGPDLAKVFGKERKFENGATLTADEKYLRESIIEPQKRIVAGYAPVMPTYKNQLDEEQIIALISYIKSLNPEEAAS